MAEALSKNVFRLSPFIKYSIAGGETCRESLVRQRWSRLRYGTWLDRHNLGRATLGPQSGAFGFHQWSPTLLVLTVTPVMPAAYTSIPKRDYFWQVAADLR